ncbi:MAG: AtpZ/AtpI family protein [Cyanobacteriota bacterium]|nr:AtpZ/AtpI family protein [Cyanobacteriota bacterium]
MKRANRSNPKRRRSRTAFYVQLRDKVQRKLQAKQEGDRTLWLGLGTFGIVGWSVALPTLLGIAIGIWIDTTFPSRYSWTLMFLFVGVAIGCFNAWYWIQRESGGD